MKGLCGMCGEREFQQVLCRTDNPDEQWLVCLECALSLLGDPDLAPMWRRVGPAHAAAWQFPATGVDPTSESALDDGDTSETSGPRGPFLQ